MMDAANPKGYERVLLKIISV